METLVGAGVERAAARSFGAGLWRLADPKISLASGASMFLGACAAAARGPLHWGWLAATVVGIFCIEVAKNASGEVFDWDSGVDRAVRPEDRTPFSGGKRVLVDGLLTRRQTEAVAVASYLAGIALGLAIAFGREPAVLWLGVTGVAIAFFYHAPPLKLSYRGLGEPAVALVYGPLIAMGTVLVQTGTVDGPILLASLPLGLLIGLFLWINEFPDYAADKAGGKHNLVTRLGRPRAARVFAWGVALAFLFLLALPFLGLPWPVVAGLVGAPPAALAARRLLRDPEQTARLLPAQVWTLLGFVLAALGTGLGWLVA